MCSFLNFRFLSSLFCHFWMMLKIIGAHFLRRLLFPYPVFSRFSLLLSFPWVLSLDCLPTFSVWGLYWKGASAGWFEGSWGPDCCSPFRPFPLLPHPIHCQDVKPLISSAALHTSPLRTLQLEPGLLSGDS